MFFFLGANINVQTTYTGETALTIASQNNFHDVVVFLLNNGAQLELGTCSPLMVSAHEGHLQLVKYFLQCGADVNSESIFSETSLTYSCRHGSIEVVKLLIESGANVVCVVVSILISNNLLI